MAKPATVHSPSCLNFSGTCAAKSADATMVWPSCGGDLFQPRGEVHRRADTGEVEPVAAADVAVHHVAGVERKSEADRPRRLCGVESVDAPARVQRAGECALADLPRVVGLGEREDRQQAVADEFQHLAAAVEDRRHLAVEIAVEQIDQLLRRQPFGQRREAAHVRQPDHGADFLDEAAPDFAGQDALAGLMADIGVEQIGGGPPQRADFRDPRQRRDDRFEIGELLAA